METQEYISERPELPFADAIKQSGLSFDELIFRATTGEITIYILAENWKVFQVNSINYLKYIAECDLVATQLEDKHSRAEKRLGFHVNYKNKFENTFNEATDQNSIQAPVSDGYFTLYPKNGVYGLIYALPLIGFKPISRFMLNSYRGGNKKIAVALNLTENPIPVDEGTEVIVLPSTKILLDDAFNNNQLYVMKKDMLKLASKEEVPQMKRNQEAQDHEEIKPASAVPASAENKPKVGLTTHQIAMGFEGIIWDYDEWKSSLADAPKWLQGDDVRLTKGRKGRGGTATWNPVEIAKQLKEKNDEYVRKLNLAFKKTDLAPWAAEWKQYLSDTYWNEP